MKQKLKVNIKLNKKHELPPNIKDQETFHDLIKSSKKLYGDTQLVTDHENTFLDGCLPAKLYGLPKIYKVGTTMRPIHKVAKILNKYLKEFNQNH